MLWTAPATPNNLIFELPSSRQYYTLSDGVNQPEDSKQIFVETGENMRLTFHPLKIFLNILLPADIASLVVALS